MGDIFNALLDVGIDGLVGVQTLQSADVLVGTDEEDILNATLNGTGAGGAFAAPSITDIEIYNLTATDPLLPFVTAGLDLDNATGYTELWNVKSNSDLELVNVGDAAAIGMRDVKGGNDYDVYYTSSAIPELMTDGQVVIADAVGTSSHTGQAGLGIFAPFAPGENISTLDLAVSNTVRLDLHGEAANMSVFNISGTGVTELTGEDQFENLETLNSTGYNGDLTLDVSGSTILTSVATDGGDDFITVNALTVNGDLSVNMGAGEDTLGLLEPTTSSSMIQFLQGEEISSWDFTGGVAGVETLAVLTDVFLRDENTYGNSDTSGFREDATLDLDGFDGNLSTIVFQDFDGGSPWSNDSTGMDNVFALRNAPETLNIEAESFGDVNLDTGNIVDLTVTVNGDDSDAQAWFQSVDNGEMDIDSLTGPSLETLTLVNTSTPGLSDPNAGDIDLSIDSDQDHDVSALQSISVNASQDADVDLDAEPTLPNKDADMNALTTVSVIAGDDADLDMQGVPAVFQVQEFTLEVNGTTGPNAFIQIDLPGESPVVIDASLTLPADIEAALEARGYDANVTVAGSSPNQTFDLVLTKQEAGPADPVVISFDPDSSASTDLTKNVITTHGVAAESFAGLEEVVVSGEHADVHLDDVHGLFTLDVTATGVGKSGDDAEVHLHNTHATEVTVTVNTAVEYSWDTTGPVDVIDGYVGTGTGYADINIEGIGNDYGNPFLTNLTVTSARADIDLVNDLSSMTTVDLTGVTTQFEVDASGAEYAPAAGDYMTYLIGSTSSDWENGDSSIEMADARETVTFTEGDFGTVVLNDFTSGSDPLTSDRIDLSQLGFSNNGQLTFEVGEYNDTTGEWVVGGGDFSDVRITDLAAGPEMSGEIIVTGDIAGTPGDPGNPADNPTGGFELADDLSQHNMTYV